MDVHILARTHL